MNWDMVGSFADWFSGLGSIIAAGVALWVAGSEARRISADRKEGGKAIATIVCNELRMAQLKLVSIRKMSTDPVLNRKSMAQTLYDQIQSIHLAGLHLALTNFMVLKQPAPHAVAGLSVMLAELKSAADRWMERGEFRVESASVVQFFESAASISTAADDMCAKTMKLMQKHADQPADAEIDAIRELERQRRDG